jgi:hypothetical protein
MTQVVIQPSYGNKDAWRHWKDTLDQAVPYQDQTHASTLSVQDRAGLDAMHPSGTARFWGATGNHDAKMAALSTGDVVLFTGGKVVRAVGEVGHSFRNAAFADTLWDPHHERGSYRNVYSLLAFQATDIPYEEIWDLPGFNAGDNFMGLRFVDEQKGAALIEGLAIETISAAKEVARQEQLSTAAAVAALKGTVVDVEAVNAAHTSFQQQGGTVLVHRLEALLVQRYRAQLDAGTQAGRIRTATGLTDLFVTGPDGPEILEAKRSPEHQYVRQALGQLLDYVVHSPELVTRLAALFPRCPGSTSVSLLHRYGIDCVYESEDGSFTRLPANPDQRQHMKIAWS